MNNGNRKYVTKGISIAQQSLEVLFHYCGEKKILFLSVGKFI